MSTTHRSTRRTLRLGIAAAVAAVGLGMVGAPAAQAYGLPGLPPPKGDPILPYPGMPGPTAGKGTVPLPGLPTAGVVVPADSGLWFDVITPPPAAQ